ncbi:retinol dehydrogenase 16-like [Python bivittatus]|uniref:Retinol dehydrogenase 16-like n=1 Tax=Python bivittatus TaxID=176946 RepID=A0A9F5JA22_PYTBI|nr:retinol dehydrogenase 16-like [Python bivittatus]
MWLYVAALVGLYLLQRWYRERQMVENLTEKYAFITGCDSGFGNQLARQLDAQGLRVLAACLTPEGAEQLEKVTSDQLKTTLLDVTSTESVAAATEWVKTCVGNKAMWLYLAALVGLYLLRRWYRERQMGENLTEKYAFITGCDTGFGNQLARQLDARGLRVLAACLTPEGAEQLEKRTSDRLKTTLLDVTSTESVAAATEWVKTCVGNKGLWGLINNAGTANPTAPNEWLTKKDFVSVLDVNLLGLIDVTLHMLPFVRKAKGRVVNMSSVLGRLSFIGGGYPISKYGLAPDIQESYGQKFLKMYCKMMQHSKTYSGKNLRLVTDRIEHALTSRHPRARYSAGWDAKLLFLPASYWPSWVVDWLFLVFLYVTAHTS